MSLSKLFLLDIFTRYRDLRKTLCPIIKLTKKEIVDYFIVFYAIRYFISGNVVDLLINKIFRN